MNISVNLSNRTYPAIDYPQFVVYATVEVTLLIVQLYLLTSFIYFIKKRSKFKDQHNNRRTSSKKRIMFGLLILATVTGFLRACILQQSLYLPNHSPASAKACSINLNVFHALFVIGLTSLYCFLWLRQHTLYVLSNMRRLVSIHVVRFSNSLLGFILVAGLSITVGLVLSNPTSRIEYVEETSTCVFPPNGQSALNFIVLGSYGLLIFYQVSILFCFLYILRRHQQKVSHLHSDASRVASSSRSLQALMRNCSIAAAVAIITDFCTLITVSFIDSTTYQLYLLIAFEIDYGINLACVILCFRKWKQMVNPWPWKRIKTYSYQMTSSSNNLKVSEETIKALPS